MTPTVTQYIVARPEAQRLEFHRVLKGESFARSSVDFVWVNTWVNVLQLVIPGDKYLIIYNIQFKYLIRWVMRWLVIYARVVFGKMCVFLFIVLCVALLFHFFLLVWYFHPFPFSFFSLLLSSFVFSLVTCFGKCVCLVSSGSCSYFPPCLFLQFQTLCLDLFRFLVFVCFSA